MNVTTKKLLPAWLVPTGERGKTFIGGSAMSDPTPSLPHSQTGFRKPLFPVAQSSTRVSEPCWLCGRLIASNGQDDPHYCRNCRRMQAESAANELLGAAKDLRQGTGVFAILTVAERAEQLAQLLDLPTLTSEALIGLAAATADQIARRLGSVPPTPPAREYTLTELTADARPVYDAGDYRPSAQERDEHEGHFELGENDVPSDVILRIPVQSDKDHTPRPAA